MEPENDCAWKPKHGMTFDSEQSVYDFYNTYGGRIRFSIRRDFCRKNKFTNQLICRLLVCNKEGFWKVDKRDPLTKNSRAETRTGCEARLYVKLDEGIGKFVVTDFKEKHNHDLVSPECAHMLPSQRKISTTQGIELDLAAQSGLRLGQSFELMGKEAGGRQCLGFTKLDQKNYLRTKRKQSLAYGEVGNVLQYFKEKSLQDPSFFYAFQLDNEEQITNMFWADA
ncbi:protein FAR1-RELATED SEQUENCE 5-like [Camellia sinensis]|uniref:protein FAR1-RELATED SEQUENCE 5-like n=1 Tax=Camellia sinensis TaxID=4442 RepID=UPI001036C85C|nr:protein FAR1-RELATED SEQUENCE 5-like [Camellia sinensis]